MDLLQQQNRHHGLLVLMAMILFGYVFFSPNLDRFLFFTYINQAISNLTIFYFNYIGNNKMYAYFFIALLTYIICQWHLSHYVAYKPIFIALSMAVAVIIVQCAGIFFSSYMEHIQISNLNGNIQLLHNSATSLPGGHIARLVALTTCICSLTQKSWLRVGAVAVVSLILVGMGVTFYDRVFISTALLGVMVGFCVPYYLKALIFTQRAAWK